MKKSVWISLIVAAACILAGVACIAVGHGLGGHKIFTEGARNDHDMVTNTFIPQETFDRISVDVIAANLRILPAEDGTCSVVTRDREEMLYSVTVTEGVLTVTVTDTLEWYEDLFSAYRSSPTVTVRLPADTYTSLYAETSSGRIEVDGTLTFREDVNLDVSSGAVVMAASVEGHTRVTATSGSVSLSGKAGELTARNGSGSLTADSLTVAGAATVSSTSGRVEMENAAVGSLSVNVGSGSMKLEDLTVTDSLMVGTISGGLRLSRVTCGSLAMETTSGSIDLTDTTVTTHLQAMTTSGSIRFTRADAATLSLKTTSGSVKGSLLTPKIFHTDTTSGSVSVPKSTEGGFCEIQTTSGSIRVTIEE